MAGVGAGLAFLAALLSPVEMVDSDPAIALLAAQALIDHGTLSLDVYRDDPDCAYNLDRDYRVKRLWGSLRYFSLGTPILTTPAVWVANRLGFHMLRQEDEFAVQNFLSALACATVFLLLFRLCRQYLEPLPSLLIAGVSTFGSSLMSTLATGLWNTDLTVVLICLAMVHLAGREEDRPAYSYLAALLVLAFLCRPSSAIFAFALVTSSLRYSRRILFGLAVALAAGVGAWLALRLYGAPEWLPAYYFDRRLALDSSLAAIYGLVLSPSRGLLVFSPFLLPVVVGAIAGFTTLRASRMFRLAAIWIPLLLAALALKSMWWGGHSYGSRVTTELMPAFALITALLWRGSEWRRAGPALRLGAVVYLTLAVPAIAINSGQGLFNPAVRLWNEQPNIDLHRQVLFDWRFPQFLASDSQIEKRHLILEPPELAPYRPGDTLAHDAEDVVFVGWYPAEEELRWTRGRRAELLLSVAEVDSNRPYLLEMKAGALGRQSFDLSINGNPVGDFQLDGLRPRPVVHLLVPGVLVPGENRIRLTVPHPRSADTDPRELGLALHELRFAPLAADLPTVGFRDGRYMREGFSDAEEGWRWTAARRAVISCPVGEVDSAAAHTLCLTAGALGRQSAVVRLNGHRLGEVVIDGFEPVTRALPVPAGLLRPFRLQTVEFEIPGARSTETDSRLLGVAFVALRLEADGPQPPPGGEASP